MHVLIVAVVVLQPAEEKEQLLQNNEYQEKMVESTFMYLTLDLPTAPLYKDEKEQLIIPQVPLFNILAKFNGVMEKVTAAFPACLVSPGRAGGDWIGMERCAVSMAEGSLPPSAKANQANLSSSSFQGQSLAQRVWSSCSEKGQQCRPALACTVSWPAALVLLSCRSPSAFRERIPRQQSGLLQQKPPPAPSLCA